MSPRRGAFRQTWTAVRALLVFTIVLGLGYTLLITAIGQTALPDQANGSLARVDGRVVGSSLLGQPFTSKNGVALPEWFQSRPSAAGSGSGYDAAESGASNLGPNSPLLGKLVRQRLAAIEKSDGASAAQVPPDAVTASASGLDPDISPAYALLQVDRVATARGLSEAVVKKLVESRIQGREVGYLGDPTVNVLELNIALTKLK